MGKHIVPDSTFGKELKKILPSLQIVRREDASQKLSFYVLPGYEAAQKEFDSYKLGRNRKGTV